MKFSSYIAYHAHTVISEKTLLVCVRLTHWRMEKVMVLTGGGLAVAVTVSIGLALSEPIQWVLLQLVHT